WRAEAIFVLAMYHEVNGDDEAARRRYLEAQRAFHRLGGRRKAAKAYHNAIAAESRIRPERRLIYEYGEACRLARAAGDFGTAGTALLNLSREYELMGALRTALKTVNRAVALLGEHQFGSYQYYLAIGHRCQLHVALDRQGQAVA